MMLLGLIQSSTQLTIQVKLGSWVAGSSARDAFPVAQASIVVADHEPSNVQVAAKFLAQDIGRLTGHIPRITGKSTGGPVIVLRTSSTAGRYEAFSVRIRRNEVLIEGSDPRGTAFGSYELSERIGIDPLYLWTGYEPKLNAALRLLETTFQQESPKVKYRGFFHDDEDIMPRPLVKDKKGRETTDANAPVSRRWYERLFETALRLKMNMVAPWVRTTKRFEIQKLASDWGLYYTSHHYDTLLSDPYHFTRPPNLAEKRGVKPEWDFVTNRDGMIRFWKGGVDENKSISCIWPIGMRGTNDYSYSFPKGWTEDQRVEAFNEALQIQVDLVNKATQGHPGQLFHFTMYTEMLPYYLTGKLRVPAGVIIVWPDNNDGVMRGLPKTVGEHPNGVYYHLAYLGGNISKQTAQIVSPEKIEAEFRKIEAAKATEYILVNVSELREFVLGARMVEGFMWGGSNSLASALERWCKTYFPSAPREVKDAYLAYFHSVPTPGSISYGATKVIGAVGSLQKKFAGQSFSPAMPDTLPNLLARRVTSQHLSLLLATAREKLKSEQERRFFFENVELPAAMDRLPTLAGISLVEAMTEPNRNISISKCKAAMEPLKELSVLLRKAERPPFERWYGRTWISERNNLVVDPIEQLESLLLSLK